MAKIGKQWGTIIACWAVALAFIITGICLGTIIPSKAVDEKAFEVTFGDKVNYYAGNTDGMLVMQTELFGLSTTAENPAVIKLMTDINAIKEFNWVFYREGEGEEDYQNCYYTLDLNGHIIQTDSANLWVYPQANLTIIDSNPTAVHYCAPDGDGYRFADVPLIGYTAVKGGVISGGECGIQVVGELTIDGGTYLGTGGFVVTGGGKMMVNNLYSQVCGTYEDMENIAFMVERNGTRVDFDGTETTTHAELVINGGTIYGNFVYYDSYTNLQTHDSTTTPYLVDDLTALPTDSPIKVTVAMQKTTDDNGLTVYQAAKTTDDQPDTDGQGEQITADSQTNLIGLIILGVAAAVLVIGVVVIIVVGIKQRKKAA